MKSPSSGTSICERCRAVNTSDAQFCEECGAEVVGAPGPGRKVVTVLFCDVVGYTELGERLDPESVHAVLSRHFDRAAAVIEHHGGTVEKFVGDEVMAVFGVPVVREDDALRAIRAAVALRDSVATLDGLPDGEPGLRVRIGVNTGEVVADPADEHGIVTGDAVSVGKRLETAAAPDEIVLGRETYLLVAHAVSAEPLEPLILKGKSRPVPAYRLESVDPDATAIPRRLDSPLVGRVQELERLRNEFDEVVSGAGGRLVTIVGEPGIGKSRLARAFTTAIEPDAAVLVGRCPPYGEGITFWPVRELLRQAGRDETVLEGSSHETFAAVLQIFEELAADRPLVAVFDDVHWAEPTFLDFVEYLGSRLADAPILILCLSRPQLFERRPDWAGEQAATLMLQPLSGADSEAMLEALGAPRAVRSRIAEAAEGNPLFVEQLAAIADENSLPDDMPGSIRGVLHERLDRLSRGERATLERAAVAGRSFTLETVLDLTPAEEREAVAPQLLGLVRGGLLRPGTTADEGFRFHHALIRDAAYDSISKSTRAALHEQVAKQLESKTADDAVIGFHLEHAYELRRSLGDPDPELATRAGRVLRHAGMEAFARTDLPATMSLLERARALLPEDEALELLPELGKALFEAGKLADADDVLSEAIDNAPSGSLLEARARVEQQFVRTHAETADLNEAERVAGEALEVFEKHGDDLGWSRAAFLRAWVDWNEGLMGAADESWRLAETHARAAGEQRVLFEILGWRASAACEGPTPVPEAIRLCNDLRFEVRSDLICVAVTLHPLAALHAMLGEFEQARSLIREGNANLADAGRMQSAVSHHEALVEMLAGNPAAAERRLRVGYERLEEMGEKALLSTTAAMLAEAIHAQGRHEEAGTFCAVSQATADPGDLVTQMIWRGVRAKLLAHQGAYAAAEALAQAAVQLAARTDLLSHHGDVLLDLAEVFRLGGKPDQADAAVRAGIELYARKGNIVQAERARALVAVPA